MEGRPFNLRWVVLLVEKVYGMWKKGEDKGDTSIYIFFSLLLSVLPELTPISTATREYPFPAS